MKKIFFAVLFFLFVVTAPVYTYSLDQLPNEKHLISISTGGFMLIEWSLGYYYLVDTRSGRVYKLIGELDSPDHFELIKYEVSKGSLSAQPENEPTNQFPGRFAFTEFKNKNYVLDTVAGNISILRDSYKKPIKLTLVPRKD